MATNSRLRLLSTEEVSTIYGKCVEFLTNSGVQVTHPQALEILNKAGAWVDFRNERVRFSRDIIEESLRIVPHTLTLAGADKSHDLSIPSSDGKFYVVTATGAVSYLDPESNTFRDVTLSYVEEWAQLCEVLKDISGVFFPFPKDVPLETADIHALKATLENTGKHILVQPYSFESLKYLFELAMVVAGSKDAMRKRPIINMVSCALPPLKFKPMDIEALILATNYGVPIFAASLPTAGGTSPITIPGTVLQSGIEILALLVMSQLIEPGAPFIGNPVAFTLDMATGRNVVASVEAVLCEAASAQYIKEAYKIPTAPFGYATDSPVPDGQSVVDRLLLGLLVAMGDSDILTEAGQLEAGLVCSSVQLIIDNVLAGMLKRVHLGVKVDDDTLAWKEVFDIEPGSHYLEKPHTLKHCREALRPELFLRQSREDWLADGGKDMTARAEDKYRELKKKLQPQPLTGDVKKELNKIVKRADERLVK